MHQFDAPLSHTTLSANSAVATHILRLEHMLLEAARFPFAHDGCADGIE